MDELLSQPESMDAYCDNAYADGGPIPQFQEQVAESPGPRKVLVLEDEPAQLYILRQHLDSIGLQSVPATSLRQAWQKLQEMPVPIGDSRYPSTGRIRFRTLPPDR